MHFTADSSDRGHQAGMCFVLGNEGIHNSQCVFRNPFVAGNHDDWKMWPQALYFGRNLMPIHFRHVVVEGHGSNCARYRNFHALSGEGSCNHIKSTSFQQRSLVTQHAVIVVDAENCFACWVI